MSPARAQLRSASRVSEEWPVRALDADTDLIVGDPTAVAGTVTTDGFVQEALQVARLVRVGSAGEVELPSSTPVEVHIHTHSSHATSMTATNA